MVTRVHCDVCDDELPPGRPELTLEVALPLPMNHPKRVIEVSIAEMVGDGGPDVCDGCLMTAVKHAIERTGK